VIKNWVNISAFAGDKPANDVDRKYLNVSYYLKFAISQTGQLLLMASNHPEGA